MSSRYLLDTHIVVRWFAEPEKLSREQSRVLREAVHKREPLSVSAISLVEIALLFGSRNVLSHFTIEELFVEIENHPAILIVPLSVSVAAEVAALGPALRDPSDRVIVATARTYKLRLLTSDQRILASGLVPTVD